MLGIDSSLDPLFRSSDVVAVTPFGKRGVTIALVFLVSTALIAWKVNAQVVDQIPSVIQLPSFSQFSYSGSVLVPVGGSTYLGGVKRSASRSSRRGWNRTAGRVLGNSGAVVAATIIDLQEMDRQILRGGRKELMVRHLPNGARLADRTEEGKSLVRFARRQYKQGDNSGAYHAYRMAIDLLDGRLRQLAIAEFRRLY